MATPTSTLTPKKEKEATLPFRKLAALGSGGSDVNAADTLDELIKAGYSLKRDDIIGFTNKPRRFKKYFPQFSVMKMWYWHNCNVAGQQWSRRSGGGEGGCGV
ncbi:hypothetical protein Ancab_000527 [Ancistrocladus abbreviatus]